MSLNPGDSSVLGTSAVSSGRSPLYRPHCPQSGLGCWLIGNQSAVRSEQRRRLCALLSVVQGDLLVPG
ncbi:hypothetical protein EYF80_050472 [Liparis tanakae]|uniref:Uncharacterized protein n=1 Tax=Liparis tanakae TaxID=230148 RepID=A0A4Z2FDN5_9TELE|nr:hypothetical protein EYF80_050472 [Liparis tanakae]